MKHTFQKAKCSEDFLKDCRRDAYFIKETAKTITMEIHLDNAQKAYLASGQATKRGFVENFYPNCPVK